MVSPKTRFSSKPCSKLTCAGIWSVQRLLSLPNSLGERWSISLRAWALFWSKAAWVLLGREEPANRAFRPRSLKSWMASRTVCCPQPRFLAICGTSSPLEEARSIWERRKVKASLERREASSRSRSSVFGAQRGFEPFALVLRELANEDWRFHGHYCNSQPETYSGDTLAGLLREVVQGL